MAKRIPIKWKEQQKTRWRVPVRNCARIGEFETEWAKGRRWRSKRLHTRRAFTFIELVALLAGLLLVAMVVVSNLNFHPNTRSKRINCTCNLKQVGLAFKQWALDHNDQFPMEFQGTNGIGAALSNGAVFEYFLVLSNELATPKVLVCPADNRRAGCKTFSSWFGNSNISYFVGVDTRETNWQALLTGDRNITNGRPRNAGVLKLTTNELAGWTEELHVRAGNVGLADGSVQQLTTTRLRDQIANSGVATNRLAMP